MAKRYKYKLSLEEDTAGGAASLLMAGVATLSFLVAIGIAFWGAGSVGIAVGALGVVGFLMAAGGFIIGLASFREQQKNHRFSTIGSLANGVLAVLWLALFLTGVS